MGAACSKRPIEREFKLELRNEKLRYTGEFFLRLLDIKAAQNVAVVIVVQRKSFKFLSATRFNPNEKFNKTFVLNSRCRKFALPTDCFVRKVPGMEHLKFPGKINLMKNEGDVRLSQVNADGTIYKIIIGI